MIFYSLILGMGIIFLIFTSRHYGKKKRKIHSNQYRVSLKDRVWQELKHKLVLWKYYFLGGNPDNLLRNSLIVVIVYTAILIVNAIFVKFDEVYLSFIYLIAFILGVWKWGKRQNYKIFEASFPEVIQVLNSSTTAGAGLLKAIERCGKDVQGKLGDEFKQIYKRLAIGEDVSAVLEDSYTRWPYKEFYYFITIIRINVEKGGQMKEVIYRLGRVLADAKKMEKKKGAMTSEARMSAMIVGSFPLLFFLFMKVQMPENFDFVVNNPNGRIILYYVLGSEAFGMSVIYWLMKKAS